MASTPSLNASKFAADDVSSSKEVDNSGDDQCCFVEIRSEQQDRRPRTIEAFAIYVEPKDCSKVVRQLSRDHPLSDDLSHLKRVSKSKFSKDIDAESAKKKPKLSCCLEVLVSRGNSDALEAKFGPLHVVTVPGRPAQSQAEAKEFNDTLWPTQFFALKSQEYKEQQLALQADEIALMKETIQQMIANQSVVIVDPSCNSIVAQSNTEAQAQVSVGNNPLATPILLALQGVSRLERQAAVQKSMDNFSKGQYLCTGYDLYSCDEPSIFEAMACVHARLRRLIFVGNTREGSVWRQGCSKHHIHCLPGTNHNFRAFEYRQPDDN